MRRLALIPLLALIACGGPRATITTSQGEQSSKPGTMDPAVLRRSVDTFGERLVARTAHLADDIDRANPDPFMRRKTLQWRLRSAQVAFRAQHNANTLVALIELWYWTSTVASYLETPKVAGELGASAEPTRVAAASMRNEADTLAQRALPPEMHQRLQADIQRAIGNGELFAADSAESEALLDQFLNVTRLEKLLSIPLAPFEVFGSVSQGTNAAAQMAITADRAVDLMEKYPQMLQWQMNLLALDIEDLGTIKRLENELTKLNDTASKLPAELRTQGVGLLNDSQPAQATAQRTLEEARLTSDSVAQTLRVAQETVTSLAALLASFAPPPGAPPKPEGPPFRIQDYSDVAKSVESATRELRAALADLQQPALTARAQDASQAVIDQLSVRIAQLIGLATVSAALLIWFARWRRS